MDTITFFSNGTGRENNGHEAQVNLEFKTLQGINFVHNRKKIAFCLNKPFLQLKSHPSLKQNLDSDSEKVLGASGIIFPRNN